MTLKELILYYAQWLIPSTTLGLYLLVEVLKWGWIPSYFIASIVSGTVMIPLNRMIFSRGKYEQIL